MSTRTYNRRTPAQRRSDEKKAVDKLARAVAEMSTGDFSRPGRTAGRKAGARVGRYFGSRRYGRAIGGAVGQTFGKNLGYLVGRGDYTIQGLNDPEMPRLAMDSKTGGVMKVCRSEYVTDIFSASTGTPSDFALTNYQINPGLDTVNGGAFTWLPQLARAYEEYQFVQLVFEYRPTSGSATGSDTSVGTVVMAGQYSQASTDYTNKQQMLNSMFSTSGAPYNKHWFPVELDKLSRPLQWHNVRSGDLPANFDLDLSDTLRLSFATQGCPSNSQNLGELWVHYECHFQKPTVTSTDSNIETAVGYIAGDSGVVSAVNPFGTASSLFKNVSGNTFQLSTNVSTNAIVFPKSFGPPGSVWNMTVLYKGTSTAGLVAIVPGTINGFSVMAPVFSANVDSGSGSASPLAGFANDGVTSSISAATLYLRFDGVTDGSSPYIVFDGSSAVLPANATDMWISVSRDNSAAVQGPDL